MIHSEPDWQHRSPIFPTNPSFLPTLPFSPFASPSQVVMQYNAWPWLPHGSRNTSPPGPTSIDLGTATRLPPLLLTQRNKTGFALVSSSSGVVARPAAAAAAAAAPFRFILGACFLRSLLMVSICQRITLDNSRGHPVFTQKQHQAAPHLG